MPDEDVHRVLTLNLEAAIQLTRACLKSMLRQRSGCVINITSVIGIRGNEGQANYAASKGGLLMFMKSLAQEVAHNRIRVNSISPGAIKTPINRAAWETPEAEAELLTLIPYQRVGDPMDIGHAAVWLASDASDYMTGTTLYIDGGMTLYPGFREGG